MGKDTDIQWCDSTCNPTMGCDGCELWNATERRCYAGVLHERYGGRNAGFSPTFDQLTFYAGRMAKAAAWSDLAGTDRPEKPWLNGRPRHVFVSDMSDALSKAVSFEFLKAEVIDNATSPKGRRHVYMWLTKQAARMVEFCRWLHKQGIPWPANLWPGTSITRRSTLARADHLANVGDGRTTRFLSVEPLWEWVDLRSHLAGRPHRPALVIVGGESGPGAKPCDVAWIRLIRAQCAEAGVPCFVKQLGSHVIDQGTTSATHFEESECWPDGTRTDGHRVLLKDSKGGDPAEWMPSLRLAREFPARASEPAQSQ